MRFCLLTGGTPHCDDLLSWKDYMERLGRSIAHFTPVLRNLHIPFINDYIAEKLSFHPTLQVNKQKKNRRQDIDDKNIMGYKVGVVSGEDGITCNYNY